MRGRHIVNRAEMVALLNQLARIDLFSHYPHGRPVVKAITRGEVDGMFKRR